MDKLELADKVEAGEQVDLVLLHDAISPPRAREGEASILWKAAHQRSTDAALQLLEQCLPRVDYCLARVDGEYDVSLGPQGTFETWGESAAKHPAQAILSALLRALHAKENEL